MRVIALLAGRELRLGLAGWGLTIVFFLLVATLFPFALGPNATLLAKLAPGVLWIAALLATLLPVERLIAPDRDAGPERKREGEGRAEAIDATSLGRIELGLLIGTPALAALSIAVAALTAASRGASAIAGLLLLPLAVPVLIFGSAMASGEAGAFGLLAATALLLIAGSPFAAGAAMRAARD